MIEKLCSIEIVHLKVTQKKKEKNGSKIANQVLKGFLRSLELKFYFGKYSFISTFVSPKLLE